MSDDNKNVPLEENNNQQFPLPTYAQIPYSQSVNTQPTYFQPPYSQNYIPPSTGYAQPVGFQPEFSQPRATYQEQPIDDKYELGWVGKSCTGLCGTVILLFLIVGIAGSIPWLGLFAAISLVPGIFILWLLYWRKNKETVHLSRVAKFIAIGMLGVIPVAIIEYIVGFGLMSLVESLHMVSVGQIFMASFFNAFLVAALCEETFKYVMAATVTVLPQRDIPYSVLVYSMSGAVGLATLENMMYVVLVGLSGNFALTLFTAITRAVMAVPLHTITGILIGADVAEKRFGVHSKSFFGIIWLPITLHGVYDFCSMFASAYAALYNEYWILVLPIFSLLTVIVGAVIASKRRNKILRMQDTYLRLSEEERV